MKCRDLNCDQNATVRVLRIKDKKVSTSLHFCPTHAQFHFQEECDWYYSGSRTDSGKPLSIGDGVAFNIDFIYSDQSGVPPQNFGQHYIQLIERGGCRYFGFETGSALISALCIELFGTELHRPVTHRVMISALEALSGELKYVEIDAFHPDSQVYEAKLHVQQRIEEHIHRDFVIDARPSDAITFALICNVPIMVSDPNILAGDIIMSPPGKGDEGSFG